MPTGKLTIYLHFQEAEPPFFRLANEGLKLLPKNGHMFFVGFNDAEEASLREALPPSTPLCFVELNNDFFFTGHKELFKLIPKVIIFKQLTAQTNKLHKLLDIIAELLKLDHDIHIAAPLSAFVETITGPLSQYPDQLQTIPQSFYKYIDRVIVASGEKPLDDELFSAALTLSTHIKNENFKHNHTNPTQAAYTPSALTRLNSFLFAPFHKVGKFLRKKEPCSPQHEKSKSLLYTFSLGILINLLPLISLKIFHEIAGYYIYGSAYLLLSLTTLVNLQRGNHIAALAAFFICGALIPFIFVSPICAPVSNNSLYISIFFILGMSAFFLVCCTLASKRSIRQIQSRLDRLRALSSYTETLASCVNDEAIIKASEQYFKETFGIDIRLLLAKHYTPSQKKSLYSENPNFAQVEETLQAQTSNYPEHDFLPLASDSITFGYIGLKHPQQTTPTDESLLKSSVLQLKLALQRLRLSKSYQFALMENEKEQLRSVILSSISHDLKTPLTTIIGSCTALEELPNLSNSNRMSLIRGIHDASEQLNQSISNILESSKLSTDNILRSNQFVYLDDVINTVLKRMKRTLKLMNVSINIPSPEKTVIQGDITLIQQVFFNLIDNASKHTPVGGEIGIHVATTPDLIIAKVFDNGPGVETARRNVIFDKFYRFQHTDHKKAGTGLGLAICKQIIEAHKGKIWISDRDDQKQGAQFNIELPRTHKSYS